MVAIMTISTLRLVAGDNPAEETPASNDQQRLVVETRIPEKHPRLFFTADELHGLRGRYLASSGFQRELFERVIASAREITTRPIPAYRAPEQLKNSGNPSDSALSELWLRPIGDQILSLSYALLLTEDPAIKERLRQLVLAVCEYPTWGQSRTGIELATAHLARGIAIAYDWHPDLWSSREKDLIVTKMTAQVGKIYRGLTGSVFWAKAYENNHNHVCVAALGLSGVAFFDVIPDAPAWLEASLADFEEVMKANGADGSTPEGISYWNYSLTFILQFIEGTRRILGTERFYRSPFLRNAASYRLHSATSGFGTSLPWGDLADTENPSHIAFALASFYQDPEAQFLGRMTGVRNNTKHGGETLSAMWYDAALKETPPSRLDHHFASTDIATTRTGWTDSDYLLTLKSGINNRNHGQLDAGSIALAFGDEWLLTAPRYGQGKLDGTNGYWDFGKADGEGRRWTYFSAASESHGTLLIDGRNQRSDRMARGTITDFVSEGDWCWIRADLTEVYRNVSAVRRTILHRRARYILVYDEVESSQSVRAEWLAQVPPFAECREREISVTGQKGELQVRALLPASATFSVRKPTAPHFDLPADRLKTISLAQSGTSLRFCLALLPFGKGDAPKVGEITARQSPDGVSVILQGTGWTDKVSLTALGVNVIETDSTKHDQAIFQAASGAPR